jgi:hypothetical protein
VTTQMARPTPSTPTGQPTGDPPNRFCTAWVEWARKSGRRRTDDVRVYLAHDEIRLKTEERLDERHRGRSISFVVGRS